MLRRAGYDDVTVFERGERVGGVWHHNTYPGAACDVPSHLYEFSFAPNPRWSRRYAPQAEIQAYLEDVARRHGVLDRIRTGTEVTSARWDERARHVGARDQRRRARGRRPAHRLRPAVGADACRRSRASTSFDGPAFHTARWRHDVDLAGKRVAVVGTGCSAIQVVPAIQPIVEQRRRLPALARLDDPEDGLRLHASARKRLFERFPVLQRLDRAAIFAFMELGAAGDDQPPLAAAAVPRARAAGRSTRRSTTPSCARKVTPTDEVGCKRIMLTDEWYPTLTKPNVELVTDRIAEVTPTGRPHRGRRRAPGRRARARDRLQDARLRRADGDRRRRRPHARARSGRDVPRAYLGHERARLPEHVPALRARTRTAAPARSSTRSRPAMSHVIAALDELDRADARADRGPAPRPPRRSTASCAPRWPGPSGTPAARTGTSTRTATTRTSGRGCGARTAAAPRGSSPAPYELSTS